MRVIVQKSRNSWVAINKDVIAEIDEGLALLVAFKKTDTEKNIDKMVKKILNLRFFDDNIKNFNKSIINTNGWILSVSNFTLYGDLSKGNRPNFGDAMPKEEALKMYNLFNKKLSAHVPVEVGEFGANMRVNINNDGPATVILET